MKIIKYLLYVLSLLIITQSIICSINKDSTLNEIIKYAKTLAGKNVI